MEATPNSPTGVPLISPYSGTNFDSTVPSATNALRSVPADETGSQTQPRADPGSALGPTPHSPETPASALTVLPNGSLMKVQKTRQRKVHSCVPCHKKKIKCSRDHPVCKNCRRAGVDCKYFVNKRVSRGGRLLSNAGLENMPDHEANNPDELGSNRTYVLPYLPAKSTSPHGSFTLRPNGDEDLVETGQKSKRISTSSSVSAFLNSHSGRESSHTEPLMVDFGDYSGFANSPDSHQKIENIPDNGPTSANTNLPLHQHKALAAPQPNLPANNVLANFEPAANVHQVPCVDSANKAHIQYFQPAVNIGHGMVPGYDEQFPISMTPQCFTPLYEIAGSNNMKSSMHSNNNVRMDYPQQQQQQDKTDGITHQKQSPAFASLQHDLHRSISPLGPGAHNGNGLLTSIPQFFYGLTPPSHFTHVTPASGSPKQLPLFAPVEQSSLNPYTSNPATKVNFLYGTNVNYENGNIFLTLLTHLPKKERSFELIDRYLNSVHVLLPILVNVAEFVREHERFWAQQEPNFSQPNAENFDLLQFFTLYFPVVYASTISEFEEYDNLLLNQDIDKYLKAFNKICQHFNYPHGLKSMSLLLGNVIIQSTSPNPSTMEMSQIIRYAKFLHLHKDPVKTLRIHDSKVIGFRRKLWWVIFGLDALSSHNFCLPPVCRFTDFNVEIPEYYDQVLADDGMSVEKKLNISTLGMSVKFRFDRILSDLVYQLHNGLASNISPLEVDVIREQICSLFVYIHDSVQKLNDHYKAHPPQTVTEINMFNFVKHHSWSFADRALMLLHKKMLLADRQGTSQDANAFELASWSRRSGPLSLSEFEDTFGRIQEANIIKNFHESSIGLLQFNKSKLFSYNDIQTNLIPSVLHNLNDFLKYNDFIKFGKFNWYVKRTIPLDSIILLIAIMAVKLKYDYMKTEELVVYVKLVNKTLFILNRKYFKNEKYKRMLSLTNNSWEYVLKKYNVVERLKLQNGAKSNCTNEFLDHQVAGIPNMGELFTIMDVPQPAMLVNGEMLMPPHGDDSSFNRESAYKERCDFDGSSAPSIPGERCEDMVSWPESRISEEEKQTKKNDLMHLNQKIYYDLRNNFVDINDYCTFYSSLENVLHALMNYVNEK